MHTREAIIDDLPQLVALGRQLLEMHLSYDPEYYLLEDNFDELFGNWIKGEFDKPNSLLMVAEETEPEKKIIGFISGFIKYLYPWFRTKNVGHIGYLIVDPTFRQKGVGKTLSQAADNWFKAKNVSYIEVYTDEKNQIGQIVWDNYGFLPFKKFLRKKI
ncbi:GNAT family N-acetyltransferase [Candidatus Microgenomates bacterium]|nr:GNAT family N-acetyltransferase [Candidatus Microgenomates bacterium]